MFRSRFSASIVTGALALVTLTGGTANTWSNVLGATANRPDICIPGEVVAP